MNNLHKYLALAALALLPTLEALAQDVTMRFDYEPVKGTPGYEHLRGSIWTYTKEGVKVQYIPGVTIKGASIYNTWADYDIIVTSARPIAVIEMDGKSDTKYATNTNDVVSTVGTLKMHPDETSIWTGNASSVTFRGAQASSRYYFTEFRIWFVGTPYGKQYVADPIISVSDSSVDFSNTTVGTEFHYTMQFAADGKIHTSTGTVSIDMPLIFNVHGEASGYEPSATVTKSIPLSSLYGKQGDTDGDGRLTTDDVLAIINNLLKTTK